MKLTSILGKALGKGNKRKKNGKEIKKYIEENRIPLFESRMELLAASLRCASEIDGLYLEFGVSHGGTAREISSRISGKVLHGFDSLHGFREGGMPHWDRKGIPPTLPENVKLVVGWIQETLEPFLEKSRDNVAFIHLDVDFYPTTKYVLYTLAEKERMRKGTVIQFDEFFWITSERKDLEGEAWRTDEFEAFQEFVKEFKVEYEWIGYHWLHAAIKIKNILGKR